MSMTAYNIMYMFHIKLYPTIMLLWWTETHLNRRFLTWLHFRTEQNSKDESFSKILKN